MSRLRAKSPLSCSVTRVRPFKTSGRAAPKPASAPLTLPFLPPSPCFWHQVCGDRERLSSHEREKRSQAKQGADASSCFSPRRWCLFNCELTSCLQEVLELAFSVLYDPDETLNFVAPNKYEVSSVRLRSPAWSSDAGTLLWWRTSCVRVVLSSTASGRTGCARCWAERWGATWRAATWIRSSAWRWSSASSIWRTSPSQKPRRRFPKSLARTTSPTTTAEVCVQVCVMQVCVWMTISFGGFFSTFFFNFSPIFVLDETANVCSYWGCQN